MGTVPAAGKYLFFSFISYTVDRIDVRPQSQSDSESPLLIGAEESMCAEMGVGVCWESGGLFHGARSSA